MALQFLEHFSTIDPFQIFKMILNVIYTLNFIVLGGVFIHSLCSYFILLLNALSYALINVLRNFFFD